MTITGTCYRLVQAPQTGLLPENQTSVTKSEPESQHARAVAEMYRQHGGMVLRRIRRFYRGDEAEEVLQEVFLRVLTTKAVYRGESSTVTWLYRLTTRYCLNRLRDTRRREELIESFGAPTWGVGIAGPRQESMVFLDQLWRTLDPDLALIGVYHFVDGLPQAEIATMMGVSRRTIGNRIATLQALAKEAAGDQVERS